MAFLSITALLDDGHDDVLGGHEGELLRYPTTNDLGVDDHALGNVLQDDQQGIGGQVGLGDGDTTVGAAARTGVSPRKFSSRDRTDRRLPVVEGSLEPLHTAGHQSVLLQDHQVPSQRAGTLGTHGVPLKGARPHQFRAVMSLSRGRVGLAL